LFEQFFISKPITSRPANSEIYIVGLGYKGYNKDAMDELFAALERWNKGPIPDEQISEIKEECYATLVYASYKIYERQIYFIKKNVKLIKDYYETSYKPGFFDEERQDMLTFWISNYPLGNITKEKIEEF
jgi:hypothetical protein